MPRFRSVKADDRVFTLGMAKRVLPILVDEAVRRHLSQRKTPFWKRLFLRKPANG